MGKIDRKPTQLETLPITFDHTEKIVYATIHIGRNTIAIRFESMEQLLNFTTGLMQEAVQVWPDHPMTQEYLS